MSWTKIASGSAEWVDVIREFYGPFSERLDKAESQMPETKGGP